ncbi:MAG TPA: hypothetical protein VKC17_10925 [Sphingomicrobium sp.]|nr:hypothetical protein [Sphingomicrobium sp.]
MTESSESQRRRWLALGELIAIAALIVSAVGVWIAWKSSSNNQPTRVVEQRQPIPLTLRGTVENDGRELVIAPVEASHALESLTLTVPNANPIELGSDGSLDADTVASKVNKDEAKGTHRVTVNVKARYVEMGKDRTATGKYVLRYEIEGGGLLGGRSLRLDGLSR